MEAKMKNAKCRDCKYRNGEFKPCRLLKNVVQCLGNRYKFFEPIASENSEDKSTVLINTIHLDPNEIAKNLGRNNETMNKDFGEFIFILNKFIDSNMFGFQVNEEEQKKQFKEIYDVIFEIDPNMKNMSITIRDLLNHLLFYFREI